MTTSTRHHKRVEMMQHVFALSFNTDNQANYILSLKSQSDRNYLNQLLKNLTEIDKRISLIANERPLEETNKLDLAIIRLAVFESMVDKTPPKVLIDEAVEMAKEFGSENSPRFVNGVLGKILIEDKIKYARADSTTTN